MTNVKETPVTTLKAELVVDIIFEKESQRYNHGIKKFKDDLQIEVPVKVGNGVKDITILRKPNYDKEGNPIETKILDSKFNDLREVGIEIDYSDVIEKYEVAVKANLELQAKELEEAITKAKLKRGEFFDKSWVEEFKANVKGDKRFKEKEYSFKEMTKDEYVNSNGKLNIGIKYKKVTSYFYLDNEKNQFNFVDGVQYFLDENEKQFSRSIQISDNKVRRGKLPKSIVHRFFTDVDVYFAIEESKKNRAKKEGNERIELKENLEKYSGEKVTIYSEMVYPKYTSGNNGNPYKKYTYVIEVGPKNDPRKFQIGMSSYNGLSFSFNGINNLSQTQFKDIIKVFKV